MPYFVVDHEEVTCAYWQSQKGYFYCQYSNQRKPKRISAETYLSAYEAYLNL